MKSSLCRIWTIERFVNEVGVKMPDARFRINKNDIDLIIYDFDGVMTDNKVLVFDDGSEAVFCNRADGLAVAKIKEIGIPQIILSTEKNDVVLARARKLEIEIAYRVSDKKSALVVYCKKNGYSLRKVLYVGNDINDLEAMKSVGYPVALQDAARDIKKIAKAIINVNGGEGAIRALYERIFR